VPESCLQPSQRAIVEEIAGESRQHRGQVVSYLQQLQAWCEDQAGAEWDRGAGIRIETIEDPGWRVHIDLRGTGLEFRDFSEVRDLCPGDGWLHCRVRSGCFEGCGGPFMLEQILDRFLDWARADSPVAA
jgi:hypothetical protein